MPKFLILFIFFSGVCFGQTNVTTTSDTTKTSNWSIIPNIQIFSSINIAGHFPVADELKEDQFKNFRNRVKTTPMVAFSLGVNYKRIFQSISFAHSPSFLTNKSYSKNGKEYFYVGNDPVNLNFNYASYQIGYDFIKSWKTLKPIILVNIAYINLKYDWHYSSEWGGNSNQGSFNDNSKTYLVQLPIGFHLRHKKLHIGAYYYLPIYLSSSGTYNSSQTIREFGFPNYIITDSENYTNKLNMSDLLKNQPIFKLSIGIVINKEKKN